MTRILLATSEAIPNLTDDDQALLRPLAARGIEARAAVWSDSNVAWASADAVLIRSCWDYHLRLEEFLRWITSLEREGVRVWNPPSMLRWNSDKIYLRDLERKGIPIVPTFWPEANFPLGEKLRDLGWSKAVIKPRVSATAYRTQLTTMEESGTVQELVENLLSGPGVMVQQFMESVVTRGEWSLIFLAGKFSHAVIKTAKAGDFRVQHDFGGCERAAVSPDFVLRAATRAIGALDSPPLYARVDGVECDSEFRLMELELIEPALFLKLAEGAAERFAEAIAARGL